MAVLENVIANKHCRLLILCAAHFLYLAVGAIVFEAIEGPGENESMQLMKKLRVEFLKNNSECVTDEELESFIVAIINASNRGVLASRNVTFDPNWNFGASLFFAASVVTTIGYGHVSPLSDGGKAFCVVYALIGLPLTLVMLNAVVQRLLLLTNSLLAVLLHRLGHVTSSLSVHIVHLTIVVALAIVLAFLLPSVILMRIEPDWNYLDALYYCFISLTTIGLGDYVPGEAPDQQERGLYKVLVSVYLFFGLVLMMLVLATFGQIPQLNIGAYFYIQTDEDNEKATLHSWDGSECSNASGSSDNRGLHKTESLSTIPSGADSTKY